jgi:hypothetical protein
MRQPATATDRDLRSHLARIPANAPCHRSAEHCAAARDVVDRRERRMRCGRHRQPVAPVRAPFPHRAVTIDFAPSATKALSPSPRTGAGINPFRPAPTQQRSPTDGTLGQSPEHEAERPHPLKQPRIATATSRENPPAPRRSRAAATSPRRPERHRPPRRAARIPNPKPPDQPPSDQERARAARTSAPHPSLCIGKDQHADASERAATHDDADQQPHGALYTPTDQFGLRRITPHPMQMLLTLAAGRKSASTDDSE